MNNTDRGIIGYHYKNGDLFSTIYVENSRTKEKEYFKVKGNLNGEEFNNKIKELKKEYPLFDKVEFKY